MTLTTTMSDMPSPVTAKSPVEEALDLYRCMVAAREIDALEQRLVNRGQASFHVSGAGHEALAAIAAHLHADDWLHCHYRDKALLVARGLPLQAFFDNLFCSDQSASRGRQMSAHVSWRDGHVLSLCGPVGNNALQATGVAAEVRDRRSAPVVLCCLGDGTTQQGEVLEAVAEAVRAHLPVLFVIEDNALAISTRTRGKSFFSLPRFDAHEFMGVPIHTVAGSDPIRCGQLFGRLVAEMRATRGPAIVVMNVERLADHTNADDQRQYRAADEIADALRHDPIVNLRDWLRAEGLPEQRLLEVEARAAQAVQDAAARAQADRRQPTPVFTAKRPLPAPRPAGAMASDPEGSLLTMGAAIGATLRRHMAQNDRITLFGQDIEDPKGDVFGITRGLSTTFGSRVENAPLSESTIVGKAIGRALAGGRPVAFLQFADFLPLAFNQIASELASMYWRTDGEWECPVIVMAPCGGYRQGLGPFHAQSFEAIACHTPGLDVLCPATAADARDLLDAAFASGRPTLFFYPKALLNDQSIACMSDAAPSSLRLGEAARVRTGRDITFVAYGNCVKLCHAAADWLSDVGVTTDIIDLRSLSPMDEAAILRSAQKTGRLLVVHEDVGTCGLGAEIVARVVSVHPSVRTARAVRAETFVPCDFATQVAVLPSSRDILDQAARLLDLDVDWVADEDKQDGLYAVRATGSPSDEAVTLISCGVVVGDRVREGELIASFETVKAAVDFESPVTGTVVNVRAGAGDRIKVGDAFLTIALDDARRGSETVERALKPVLRHRAPIQAERTTTRADSQASARPVGILSVAAQLGSDVLSNTDVASRFASRNAADVERLTGIALRRRVAPGETAVSLGSAAARTALLQAGLAISDMDAIICATGTPGLTTPSLACRILHDLAGSEVECQAHDISAACTGYLYGLQTAYDLLQDQPGRRVLLITSEVLTPLVDEADFETSLLFGDAASATILASGVSSDDAAFHVARPVLSAMGEPGRYLSVPPARSEGAIAMSGGKVFTSAVRSMTDMLRQACAAQGCQVNDLDVIVPHQANRRIIEAVAGRLGVSMDRVVCNIRDLGNTSSSTIPICLAELRPTLQTGQRIGLTAFGGGFTYGAALLTAA